VYPDPDRPRRAGVIDLLVLCVLLGLGWLVWTRVSGVLAYRWDWAFLPQVLVTRSEAGGWRPNLLLEGLLTTLRLSLWAMLFASIIGVGLGVLATRVRLFARLLAFGYVGLVRNVPPLVFIFVFYFFISSQLIPALGIDTWARELGEGGQRVFGWLLGPPVLIENLLSGVICLALFEAAYIGEVVRAGITSVPASQVEAGKSVGLRPVQVFRLIVAPQALRAVAPPLANQFILLVKNSSIVSLISVQELTFIGTEVSVSTDRRFETWIVVAGMYLVICYALAFAFGAMERRSRRAYAR